MNSASPIPIADARDSGRGPPPLQRRAGGSSIVRRGDAGTRIWHPQVPSTQRLGGGEEIADAPSCRSTLAISCGSQMAGRRAPRRQHAAPSNSAGVTSGRLSMCRCVSDEARATATSPRRVDLLAARIGGVSAHDRVAADRDVGLDDVPGDEIEGAARPSPRGRRARAPGRGGGLGLGDAAREGVGRGIGASPAGWSRRVRCGRMVDDRGRGGKSRRGEAARAPRPVLSPWAAKRTGGGEWDWPPRFRANAARVFRLASKDAMTPLPPRKGDRP